MPLGDNDYDVVIGVQVEDQTTVGSATVKHHVKKDMDDIRVYSDRQARDIARNSRDTFSKLDSDVTRSSSGIVKRLVYVFDTHNFLLRNMARQAGSTTGAVAIGVGKLALSYSRLGKDTEDASQKSRVALADLRLAVSRLGTDPSAFPAAIKATKDLSSAYEKMGLTGHAASVRAGSALEESVHKRVIALQGGLDKARSNFEKLRNGATADSEKVSSKVNEIAASVSHLLGGVKVDAPFFKAFIRARTDTEKYLLVLDRLGPKAAVAFATNQNAVGKLSEAYVRLESRAAKSIRTQSDKLIQAASSVKKYESELGMLEKGLAGVTGTTGEASVATSGFSSAMVAGGIALGVTLAVILLVIAAVAALTAIMYKSATTAAEYGNEIYKLSLSTGLSVKTLSALSVIAKETQTDVDSLAKTFARTQIQIQRGIDKPFSEAGRALRTLRVDFQELRKMNPDQQIFTLAKAFTELNNQNVRATVAQQLFSRDAERQAKMLEQVAHGFDQAQKKAKKFGLELDESGAVKANIATVAVADLKLAWEGLWVSLGIKILPQITLLMETFTEWVIKSGGAFSFLGTVANAVLREIRIQLEMIKEFASIPGTDVIGLLKAIPGARARATVEVLRQDAAQQLEYQKRVEELRRRGIQGDDQYAPDKGAKTPIEQLEDRVKKLRFEIQALMNVGSREFRLRFELEGLEKAKAGFETIFKLRSEMGLVLNEPLPTFRVGGSPEEQHQDLINLQNYVQQLERMRTVFDGVRKVANEQADSLAELARVQQEALMPVVDSNLRAEIKYHTAIRDRAKAEKELTADVIAEARLRKDAIADEVGSTLKAYMSLQRDLGRSRDTIREQRLQDEIFVRILKGGPEAESAIREKINADKGQVLAPIPNELVTIATHAASIDTNVSLIAEKMGVNIAPAAAIPNIGTTPTFPISQGLMDKINAASPDALQAGIVRLKAMTAEIDAEIERLKQESGEGPIDVVKTDTSDVTQLRTRILDDAREKASGERASVVRQINQEIIDNQARLNEELVDLDTDYLRNWTNVQLGRRQSARDTIVSIMILENDLKDLNNTNSKLYQDTWKEADRQRLEGQKSLRTEIINLQNDIANNGFDMPDRLEKSRLQGIRDIQEASNAARESIVYNQQVIADQTIYHAERADAAVMDFLAHQRGITEIISDAKIGVIDATFKAIDSGLDRITAKLGIAGDIVKELISGFIRLALSPFFRMLNGGGGGGGGIFGGGGGFPGAGTGGQGGISSIPGVITNLINSQGGGLSTPPSTSGGVFSLPGTGGGGIHEAGHTAGAVFSRAGLMQSIGGALPFLGLGIGANLGGQSRFGSILGGAGGLIAGGVGAAFLAPSLFAATGTLGSLGPIALGLLTNPFTAIAAGGLILGAILLSRNAARRKNETAREQLSQEVIAALQGMLSDAQTGKLSLSQATSQFNELRSRYFESIASFDSKTKRIATEWWNSPEHPPQVFWKQIQEAAKSAEIGINIKPRMVPVFATGGWSDKDQLIKVRPGEGIRYPGSNVVHTVFGKDLGYDTEYMFAPRGTRILNRSEMNTAVPMQTGGVIGGSNSDELPELHIDNLSVEIDGEGIAKVVISSTQFKNAVVHNVKLGKKEKKIA